MANRNAARALWITGPGQAEIREEVLAAPAAGDVLVRTLYSAISRGTESLVYAGAVPPSEYARMRAPFQAGDFPAPVKYGYINVGVVEQGPAELEGRHVFCLYPHQTRYVVPAVDVYAIPATVPAAVSAPPGAPIGDPGMDWLGRWGIGEPARVWLLESEPWCTWIEHGWQ